MVIQRSRNRYRQITQVLARHGLGFLLAGRRRQDLPSRPQHVREALEELGATFIKFGQILSTRADLLPPRYQAELARLQDRAPAVPSATVLETLEAELGRPADRLFAAFDPEPLAAASIGQVHAATLRDGTQVVVKLRRPGVVEAVEEDLRILEDLAARASRRLSLAERYDVVGLVQEFALTLRAETDYLREGENADRFAHDFEGDPQIHVPRPFWDLTTGSALTLERIEGIKIDDLAALDAAGIDRRAVASTDARMMLEMVFDHGFFHADPHPGNFFVGKDGSLGLVDFGMVGQIDEHLQDQLVWALLDFTSPDPDRHVDTLFELRVAPPRVDRSVLRRDLEHLHARYYGRPLGQIQVPRFLGDVLAVVRRHRLQLPPSFALLLKTLAMHEALVSQLDPAFDFVTLITPYARRMIRRQYSPLVWGRWAAQAGLDAARLGLGLPLQTRRLLQTIERGDLEIGVRPAGVEGIFRRLERMAHRAVLGVLTAALLVALAILTAAYLVRGDRAVVAGLTVAFGLTAAFGIYLGWSILRSSRR